MPRQKKLPKLEEKLKIKKEPKEEPRIRRTEEEIKKDKIEELAIKEPNPLFIPVLKIPFDTWAEINKLEQLRLSQKEAEGLALPITQLVEYYLPKLPPIAYAWCGLIISTYTIMHPRLKLIAELKKKKEENLKEKNNG